MFTKRLSFALIIPLFLFSVLLFRPISVKAADSDCDNLGISLTPLQSTNYNPNTPITVHLQFDPNKSAFSDLNPEWTYAAAFFQKDTINLKPSTTTIFQGNDTNVLKDFNIDLSLQSGLSVHALYNLGLVTIGNIGGIPSGTVCMSKNQVRIANLSYDQLKCDIKMPDEVRWSSNQTIDLTHGPTIKDANYDLWRINGTYNTSSLQEMVGKLQSYTDVGSFYIPRFELIQSQLQGGQNQINLPSNLPIGKYTTLIVVHGDNPLDTRVCASHTFKVLQVPNQNIKATSGDQPNPPALPMTLPPRINAKPVNAGAEPCRDNLQGVQTAIGCVPTEPTKLISGLITFATGVGGGIALLLMIIGAFTMITSQGNDQQLKDGQERFTSAVIGLLFIIFAVFLLEVVGVDILNIPGFSK